MEFRHRTGVIPLDGRTAVMGILNITPDSFSDGGKYNTLDAAAKRALEMQQEGADVLDIGAQSTRPGHTPVSAEEEKKRLLPVLEVLRDTIHIPISVDTYYREVAAAAIEAGASIINDVSGSMENDMPSLAAECGAGLIMMHAGGGADDRREVDALDVVGRYFAKAIAVAEKAGLPQNALCLDPGIGFGKSMQGDLQLVARLDKLMEKLPEVAVLVGASRKRVVGAPCGNPPFDERLAGTLAIHTTAQLHGANILRVHDVKEAVQAARVTDALLAVSHI